jgi:NDP-sugar pyrophosphorylase family protein
MIPALVLAAGLATRLRPLSLVRAKAALPVAGTPLVTRILRQLATAGITDAVVNLHYLPHTITGIVGAGSDLGLQVRYSWEDPVLGSAGGPKRAVPLLRAADPRASAFLILNGDTLTDVSLRAVVDAHQASHALVTMAVVPNTEPGKYGGALVDEDGVITGFVPRGADRPSWHVIGVQVAEMDAFADVPDHVPYESVRTLYPALMAKRRGAVRAFRCEAAFFDIGTPADYLGTSLQFAAHEQGAALVGAECLVAPTARVERSVLWDRVTVEAGAMLRECVVTDGVRVPSDTSWHGVSLRIADGGLQPGEREFEGMAIATL